MEVIPFLARLYTDDVARARFMANPRDEAKRNGLPEEVASMNLDDLDLAARSFAHKREFGVLES